MTEKVPVADWVEDICKNYNFQRHLHRHIVSGVEKSYRLTTRQLNELKKLYPDNIRATVELTYDYRNWMRDNEHDVMEVTEFSKDGKVYIYVFVTNNELLLEYALRFK